MTAEAPFLRTLSPLLRGLERHFRVWLDSRRAFPVTLVQRAEMEGLLEDVKRKSDTLDVEKPALVIMFMGGTGVGKSTLLNALAGSTIAQASFTRPTTRDPVVYHHHSLPPEKLDTALRACRLVSHDRDELAQKILVDTPDFDSNDTTNREKLLALLPVADIVLYVGSQEKYHDELGWELFKSQRQRRAFAFVLNKWDRCSDSRSSGLRPDEDLLRDLAAEGFESPRLFRTTAQAWLDSPRVTPNVPEGEQFPELLKWLEVDLTRREIEAVKARGVLQMLAQAKSTIDSVRPPELREQAERVKEKWPDTLAAESRAAAEVLVGALDPASSEIEQHFAARGQQRFRGLMAAWLKLTSLRWGVRNLIRSPLPSLQRLGLGEKEDGLNFTALAEARTGPTCDRILKERSQSLTNRLLVEADQQGFPIAILNERVAAVQNKKWNEIYSHAVAESMEEVEHECVKPTGLRAAFRAVMTFLANYLPEIVLLGSLGVVLWLFIMEQTVPSLALMLMPIYVTLGTLILLQLLMALLFPIRWSVLRDDFQNRLERKVQDTYEQAYLGLPEEVAAFVRAEREAVNNLASEVKQVSDWLRDKEAAAKVNDLYGK